MIRPESVLIALGTGHRLAAPEPLVAMLMVVVETPMDEKTVRSLEQDVEDAIAGVVSCLGLRRLPLLPSQQTMHLMAKAAVAVYESAVENQQTQD